VRPIPRPVVATPPSTASPSSGWSTCARIAGLVQERGLPAISRDYLAGAFSSAEWLRAEDVFDKRLPAGELLAGQRDWSMVVSVIGAYGPSLGSYQDVVNAPVKLFTVLGEDTRELMIRQIWGARVLQAGATPPNLEHNERWTFTLSPGEKLVDGQAVGGRRNLPARGHHVATAVMTEG
jgi:hypothetical protein